MTLWRTEIDYKITEAIKEGISNTHIKKAVTDHIEIVAQVGAVGDPGVDNGLTGKRGIAPIDVFSDNSENVAAVPNTRLGGGTVRTVVAGKIVAGRIISV